MGVIHEPEPSHKCSPGWRRDDHGWAGWPHYAVGTIERCDDCGRYWRCIRNGIDYRVSVCPTKWQPLRWWNFRARRNLRSIERRSP